MTSYPRKFLTPLYKGNHPWYIIVERNYTGTKQNELFSKRRRKDYLAKLGYSGPNIWTVG